MLISICYLIHQGVIQTESNGNKQLMTFEDEQQMARLYENLFLNIIRKSSQSSLSQLHIYLGH